MFRPRPYRGLWLTLALALVGREGRAQPSQNLQVALEYSADSALGCPSEGELKASVAQQLGYDPFASDSAEPRLRVEIVKPAERLEAQIEWMARERGEGERRLISDGGDCAALARSLIFAIAVQIQLHAVNEPPASEPPARPAPPPAPRPPAPPPARLEAPPAHRSVLLGLGLMARAGLAPRVTPGARLFGALSKHWWAFELSAHATLPSRLELADGTGFTANELGASVVPCLRHSSFGFCAVGALSLLHVRGEGVDRIRSPSALTGGVGARLQLLLPQLRRFGVIVQAEALALLAPQDVFLNEAKVWSTAPLAFTAILDFAAIFP